MGEDFGRARRDAGIPGARLAAAAGIDDGYYNRIENGRAQPSIEVLSAVATALGGDLSLRFYPGTGPRIYDRVQAAMIESVIAALHPRWHRYPEVPVSRPVRGVIDLVLHDGEASLLVAAEAHSEIRRLEQQVRWAREKSDGLPSVEGHPFADTPAISRLLILRSTRATRELARSYPQTLRAAYPAATADVHRALTTKAPWPGAGILWVAVEAEGTRLLTTPPRGVGLGR